MSEYFDCKSQIVLTLQYYALLMLYILSIILPKLILLLIYFFK